MKTKKEHFPNQERTILEVPTIEINKDDPTKFDVGSYRVHVIDRTNPSNPEVWFEEIEENVGCSITTKPFGIATADDYYIDDNGVIQEKIKKNKDD